MPMELNRRELKAQARERMRETRPPFWLLTLVYLLLTTGVSTLADLTGAAQFTFPPSSGDTLPLFLYLLILLYTTVMNFGYQIWALRVYRRQEAGYGTPHRRLLHGGAGAADGAVHIRLHAVLGAGVWDCGRSGAASAELAPAGSAGAADLWGGIWHRPVDLLSVRHGPLSAHGPAGGGGHRPGAGERGHDAGVEVGVFQAGLLLLRLVPAECPPVLGVELAFILPAVLELLQAAEVDPALLVNGLELPWTAALLSTLIQVPLSLWLDPYVAIAHAGFYQARVQQAAAPPPVWDAPYDGPYNGPDL